MPTQFYVTTNGNDAWSGTLDAPNPTKTDGPFATLQRVRDAIRASKENGGLPKGGITVSIRAGTYSLEESLMLTEQDSGTESAPIVYRAYNDEAVRLTGGKVVTNFQPVADSFALERLAPEARGNVLQADLRALGVTDFGNVKNGGLELFYDGAPMTLARWPNEGFVRIADVIPGDPVDIRGTKGDKSGKFAYEGDRPKRWVGEKDPWVHGYWFWDWSDERHKVESIDPERRIIAVAPPYHGYGYRKGQWFYAFNLLSELDAPGEWVLDRETGTLYFMPPIPIEQGRAVISVLDTLVKMENVEHVAFEGVTFEAARGTGVTISGGSDCRIANCLLRNFGSWAVSVNGGKRHAVVNCEITGTGNGGVSLTGGDRPTLEPAGHLAGNNHIHHYSRWNRMYQPAISLNGVGLRAAHNLIHDAPHMAIFFGGNDHVLEYNEIHHVCEESNDAGAIYAGRDWTMRGTIIRHNYLHDIQGFEKRGCVGVYLDDMFCGTLIYGNVFYRVRSAAFIGGGRDCRIENNVFVECDPSVHVDARAMGWANDHVDTTMKERLDAMPFRQKPWSERYPELLTLWEDEPAAPKGNVVTRNVSAGGRWLSLEKRAELYTLFADNFLEGNPLFMDAAALDFRLKPESPVWAIGFQPIPFDRIGLERQ